VKKEREGGNGMDKLKEGPIKNQVCAFALVLWALENRKGGKLDQE